MTSKTLQMTIFDSLDESTSSPEATPASHSLLPGSDAARRMTVTSGRRCAALLRQHGRVSSWLRTLLGTSRWASTLFYLTWKPTATPAGRLLFRLVPSTPSTAAIESGSWATPTRTMIVRDVENINENGRAYTSSGADFGMNLAEQVIYKAWPTPRHEGFDEGAHRGKPDSLHSAVKAWPTPDKGMADGGRVLPEGTSPTGKTPNGQKVQVGLTNAVKAFPAPTADDGIHRNTTVEERQASGHQVMLRHMAPHGKKLHGRWTLALMGFEPDWCDDLPPDPLT